MGARCTHFAGFGDSVCAKKSADQRCINGCAVCDACAANMEGNFQSCPLERTAMMEKMAEAALAREAREARYIDYRRQLRGAMGRTSDVGSQQSILEAINEVRPVTVLLIGCVMAVGSEKRWGPLVAKVAMWLLERAGYEVIR